MQIEPFRILKVHCAKCLLREYEPSINANVPESGFAHKISKLL